MSGDVRLCRTEGQHTVTATKAGRGDGNLDLALLWGPEGACFVAEVLWSVEDDCVMRREGDWAHCMDQSGYGKAGTG